MGLSNLQMLATATVNLSICHGQCHKVVNVARVISPFPTSSQSSASHCKDFQTTILSLIRKRKIMTTQHKLPRSIEAKLVPFIEDKRGALIVPQCVLALRASHAVTVVTGFDRLSGHVTRLTRLTLIGSTTRTRILVTPLRVRAAPRNGTIVRVPFPKQ
jgi:Holliday junction resolvasome RuvABC ATP-dependent DNA helicase subunit